MHTFVCNFHKPLTTNTLHSNICNQTNILEVKTAYYYLLIFKTTTQQKHKQYRHNLFLGVRVIEYSYKGNFFIFD